MEENDKKTFNSGGGTLKKPLVKMLFIFLLGLTLGGVVTKFALGVSLKGKYVEQREIAFVTPTPDSRILTDPAEILKSKVFSEWYGGFEAKVVAKGPKSFTLESQGQRLEVFMQDSITRLVDETGPKGEFKVITLDELPLNSVVRGSATISRGTLTGDLNQHVIANGVSVISK